MSGVNMLWLLVLVVIVLLIGYYMWQRRRLYEFNKQFPDIGLKNNLIFGVALNFSGNDEDRMNVIQKMGRTAVEKGGLTSGWMANKLYLLSADPCVSETVLKCCLDKDDTTMRFVRTLTGNGSIFAPVNIWRRRRKMIAPMFSIKNLDSFASVISRQSQTMSKLLRKEAGKGDFSIWKYFTTFTLDGICENALGLQLDSQLHPDHPFLKALDSILLLISQRLCSPWLYLDFIYKRLPQYKEFMENKTVIHEFVDDLIRKTHEKLAVHSDDGPNNNHSDQAERHSILEMLIEASSRDSSGYSDLEIREEILGLIAAGTDTSAVGTSFTTLMLSRYPEVQEKVYQELQEVFEDSDRPVAVKDLPNLKYLEAVIKETLRVYPAVPAIVREAVKDVKLPNGGTLVKGTGVLIHFWATNRNPMYWGEDAELFRPERFLEGPLKHHAQFLPFSYSMRNCVGSSYGMMSMKTALATMLRQYRVLPPSYLDPQEWTRPLRVKFDIMMKHVDNYIVRIELRNP